MTPSDKSVSVGIQTDSSIPPKKPSAQDNSFVGVQTDSQMPAPDLPDIQKSQTPISCSFQNLTILGLVPRVFHLSNLNCSPRTKVVVCTSQSDQVCVLRDFNKPQTISQISAWRPTIQFLSECVTRFDDHKGCELYSWYITLD